MKNLAILVFLFLFLCANILAQNDQFAPLGAEWNYEFFGPNQMANYKVSVEEEILIEDKICTTVSMDKENAVASFQTNTKETICSEGEKVYVYRDSTFHLLFDFGANTGDTIVVFDGPFKPFFYEDSNEGIVGIGDLENYNYFAYTITNIDSVNRNGTWLIKQEMESIGDWSFGEVIEKIGGPSSFHPFGSNPYADLIGDISNKPLCYIENNLFLPIQNDDGCDQFTAIDPIINTLNEVLVFPNPIYKENNLSFKLPANEHHKKLFIYNAQGQKVKEAFIPSFTSKFNLSLRGLSRGMYYWSIGNIRGTFQII